MFAIFGLGPSEMICLAFLGVVVIVVVVLANRTGRTTPPPRPALDDPLRRIKRDYETLTERERRQLLQFVQDDLRREQPPDAPAAPPPESYTP